MVKRTQKKKAFTIIEVVLVLAIAGLIFLMVFIALPALQRTQRNTQRKKDVDRIYTAIIEYQKNNKNKPPCKNTWGGDWGCEYDTNFIPRYVDDQCELGMSTGYTIKYTGCSDQFTDPDGTIYDVFVTANVTNRAERESYLQPTLSLATAPVTQTPTIRLASDDIDMDKEFEHTIFISFGYVCAEREGIKIPTYRPNDFIVAKRLEGGGMYCHGSSAEYSINGGSSANEESIMPGSDYFDVIPE